MPNRSASPAVSSSQSTPEGSEAPPLGSERRGNVLILTIRRSSRRNSLSRATLDAFRQARDQLTPEIRAVLVTGEGNQAFCAGADLKERRDMSEDQVRQQLQAYRTHLGWLCRSPVPTVAAINGAALGGGLELALLCDLRVAAAHAVLGLPETSLGIIPAAGGTQTLPRIVGPAKAREMILLAQRWTAERALREGLVHRVSPAGTDLLDDTLEFIRPIAEGAPIAQRAALEALRLADQLPLLQGLEEELRCYEQCLRSEDRVEALAAFAEKRTPHFRGR